MTTPIIEIVEVGPRDGLQNEDRLWSVAERVQLVDLLSDCGFRDIEVGSFVSPKWVPQMASTDEVFRQIKRTPGVRYSGLVPNEKGLESALDAGVTDISIFTAASEAFNQKNINCTIDESFERFVPILAGAKEKGLRVRGYVSCAIECPYTGHVKPEDVSRVAERLLKIGCAEISLGDTIGKGTPETTARMVEVVRQHVPVAQLAIHCHDTYGRAMGNILAVLPLGIAVIDSAINGLGGCPYAGEKAKGNVATELVVQTLQGKGYNLRADLAAVLKAKEFVLGR